MTKNTQTIQQSAGNDRDLFQLACPHYQTMNDIITSELIQAIADHTTDTPLHIIELGSGTGTTALQLVELLKTQDIYTPLHLHLVDNNPAQMELAQQRLNAYISDTIHIHYHTDDVFDFFKNLPHQAQLIYSMFTLHNFHPVSRSQLIQALSNSLPTGGILINADKIADNDPVLHAQQYVKTTQGFDIYTDHSRKDIYTERINHYTQDEKIKRTEKEYLALLASHDMYTQRDHGRFLMEKVIVSRKG